MLRTRGRGFGGVTGSCSESASPERHLTEKRVSLTQGQWRGIRDSHSVHHIACGGPRALALGAVLLFESEPSDLETLSRNAAHSLYSHAFD